MPLEAGQQLGRYRIGRLIAQGGMAEVYRAEQELAAGIFRPVALKVIRPEYAESPDFREMFLDEARTACTLSHPNIVHIYEVGDVDGVLFMAMELVSGETLATVSRTLREDNERFSDAALFAVGVFTCAALEAVHALRIAGGHINLVHRDVSPHNLLLGSTGALKLIDFGIAKAATNRNLTSPGVTKGKAGYFSPEQAMGRQLDGRSDLFSVGITLYKLASGQTPFDQHRTHQERNGALVRGLWEPLRKVTPGLPRALYDIVEKATRLKPDERYPNARAMREALEAGAFEAGLRIGPSCLSGYVTPTGEVTASGARPATAIQPPETKQIGEPTRSDKPPRQQALEKKHAPEPTPVGRQRTERVDRNAPQPPRQRRAIMAALALGLGLLGGVGAVLLNLATGEQPKATLTMIPTPLPVAERPSPAPDAVADAGTGVATDASVAMPVVAPTEVVVDAGRLAVENIVDAGPLAVAPPPSESPEPAPERSPADDDTPRVVKSPKKVAPPPPSTTGGFGKIRIDVRPSGAAYVILDGKEKGSIPLSLEGIAAGSHKVVVRFRDNEKLSPQTVTVYADQTTICIYDVNTRAWSTSVH